MRRWSCAATARAWTGRLCPACSNWPGWRGARSDKVRRAFENSTLVRFAFEGERLVGAARALSDHEYHAALYDVVVHPARQRCGIGTALLQDLLGGLRVWRIVLVADAEAAPFYRRLGFAPLPEAYARFERRYLYDAHASAAE